MQGKNLKLIKMGLIELEKIKNKNSERKKAMLEKRLLLFYCVASNLIFQNSFS